MWSNLKPQNKLKQDRIIKNVPEICCKHVHYMYFTCEKSHVKTRKTQGRVFGWGL